MAFGELQCNMYIIHFAGRNYSIPKHIGLMLKLIRYSLFAIGLWMGTTCKGTVNFQNGEITIMNRLDSWERGFFEIFLLLLLFFTSRVCVFCARSERRLKIFVLLEG